LEKAYKLQPNDLKSILKFFKKSSIEVINLNFGFNLLKNTSLKRIIDFNQLKALRELHAIDAKFNLEELSALVRNAQQLKSISFGLDSSSTDIMEPTTSTLLKSVYTSLFNF
jgi:hypothetical protein